MRFKKHSKIYYNGFPGLVKKANSKENIADIVIYYDGIWIEMVVNLEKLSRRRYNISEKILKERLDRFQYLWE